MTEPHDPRPRRAAARAGALLALALLSATAACVGASGSGSRAFRDVVTDFENPPSFRALAEPRRAAGAEVAYTGSHADAQRYAHPEIKPLALAVPPRDAYDAALDLVRTKGWALVEAVPPGEEPGRIEATIRSLPTRSEDDIVIRIGQDRGGSRIDMRSASRSRRGDLGSNARRVASFLFELRNTALQKRGLGT